ncbi:hypothetical protein MCC93_20340 [Morococcus cerebrosus]|uniref:Uncharacterized protein n=1 Tax=Morococcus cerebrosus TaxID=1056807 RepID=A0A0C1GM26_9NEIS|nr:hypothetical protein MCC93_20340 [Morococcus cerebrosus]
MSRIVCVNIGSMHSIILKYLRNADFSMDTKGRLKPDTGFSDDL